MFDQELIPLLSNVDTRQSEAFKQSDRDEIFRIIQEECAGGFAGVNKVVCGGLRDWLAWAGKDAVDTRLAEEAARKMPEKYRTDTLYLMTQVARLLLDQGDLAAAEPLNRRALAGTRQMLGPNHRRTLNATICAAALLNARNRLEEAAPLYTRALEISTTTLGPSHRTTLGCVGNLATLRHEQGRLVDAEALYRSALESATDTLGNTGIHSMTRTNTDINSITRTNTDTIPRTNTDTITRTNTGTISPR